MALLYAGQNGHSNAPANVSRRLIGYRKKMRQYPLINCRKLEGNYVTLLFIGWQVVLCCWQLAAAGRWRNIIRFHYLCKGEILQVH